MTFRQGWYYVDNADVGWVYYVEPTIYASTWALGFTPDMTQLFIYGGEDYQEAKDTVDVPREFTDVEEAKAWAIGYWRTL